MLEYIYHFDWNVFKFVEKYLWNPVLDTIMKFYTLSGNMGAIFIFICVVFFVIGFFKKNETYKKLAVCIAFSVLVMEAASNLFVKDLFSRVRPYNFDWSQFGWAGQFNYPNIVSKPESFSFPSGHSASAFSAATAMLHYNKKWGIVLVLFAVIMAFSRVYVHVHYCTDVIGGAVFGLIYGLIGILLTKLLYDLINDNIIMKIQNKIVKD